MSNVDTISDSAANIHVLIFIENNLKLTFFVDNAMASEEEAKENPLIRTTLPQFGIEIDHVFDLSIDVGFSRIPQNCNVLHCESCLSEEFDHLNHVFIGRHNVNELAFPIVPVFDSTADKSLLDGWDKHIVIIFVASSGFSIKV